MAELMRTSAGRFVVSINDYPQIREVFAGFDLVPLQLDYTIGGGQGRVKKFGELIINSWDDSHASLL
jgi:DNA adenine methylase